MAFKTPKPDPAVLEQQRLAQEARIKTVQEDMSDLTMARARRYGQARMSGLAGATG